MAESWETACYKKWMNKFGDSLSNEYKSVIKNSKNSTICNLETLNHLKDEIHKSNFTSKKIDNLFDNYKSSVKNNEAKLELEKKLQFVLDESDEKLGFGIEQTYENMPLALAFAPVAEKISSLHLEGDGNHQAVFKKKDKKKKDKKKNDNKKEGDEAAGEEKKKKAKKAVKKKPITPTKANTKFMKSLWALTGAGELTLEKNKLGEFIFRKNKAEVFKSLQPEPPKESKVA